MVKKRLPDFIGIGFRRCATTWFHHLLNSHPQIGKPENGIHFFTRNVCQENSIVDARENYIESLKPFAKRKILLDLSVSYSYPENVKICSKKIYKITPQSNIFMILRNPIDRAYSDYLRSVRFSEIDQKLSFEDALSKHPVFLDRSKYKSLVKPYLDLFPSHKIKYFIFEDLVQDPLVFCNQLLTYFSLNKNFDQEKVIAKENTNKKTISYPTFNRFYYRTKNFLDDFFKDTIFENPWIQFKNNNQARHQKIQMSNLKNAEDFSKNLKENLMSFFKEDIKFIENSLGRKIDGWH